MIITIIILINHFLL